MVYRLGLSLIAAGALLASCSEPAPSGWAGYAEGDYVYVAAPLPGRLEQLFVQPGQAVAAGAPLFRLDAEAESAARDEARARVSSAQAQAANLGRGRRQEEVAVTQAQLAQASAQVELARSELRREQQLVAQGFVAKARVEDAQTALTQANAKAAELSAALRVVQLPARTEERNAAAAQAEAASQALRQSAWRVQQKLQTAPAAGKVTEAYFRVGEYVNAGQPVLALLPPANVLARFFVPQAELATLALGQAVSLQCDGCGAPLAARISRIATAPEYTPPVIYSNAQKARLVFMLEARPEAADAARLRPGQPLLVRMPVQQAVK